MSEKIRSIRKLNLTNTLSKKEAQSIVEQTKETFRYILDANPTGSIGDRTFAHMAHILEKTHIKDISSTE